MACRSCAERRRAAWQATKSGAVKVAGRLVIEGALDIAKKLAPKPRRTLPKRKS